jgi:hypothetical protein
MEPMGCPETSFSNFKYSLRNGPEKHSFRKSSKLKLVVLTPFLNTSCTPYAIITKEYTKIPSPLKKNVLPNQRYAPAKSRLA